jgi:hypothetical protein
VIRFTASSLPFPYYPEVYDLEDSNA